MKKIAPYILILVILVGLFGLAVRVHADDTVGYCTYPNGTRVSGYTQAQCNTMAPGGSWYPGTPSSPITTTSPSSSSTCTTGGPIGVLICTIQQLLNSIIPLLMALGVVYLVWGIVEYFIRDNEEAKKKGRDRIIYGIVGLAIIIGLWGLVNLVVHTFNIGGGSASAPQLVSTTTAASSGSICAAPPDTGATVQNYLGYVTCLIGNSVIPFIFAIAVVMFIWGAMKFFIINADEEAKRAQGKQYMIWGIVALAVMLSVWGLVGVLQTTFNIKTGGTAPSFLPQVHPPTGS